MKRRNKPKIPAYIGDRMVYRMEPGHGLIQRTYDTLWMFHRGIKQIHHVYYPAEKLVIEVKRG